MATTGNSTSIRYADSPGHLLTSSSNQCAVRCSMLDGHLPVMYAVRAVVSWGRCECNQRHHVFGSGLLSDCSAWMFPVGCMPIVCEVKSLLIQGPCFTLCESFFSAVK